MSVYYDDMTGNLPSDEILCTVDWQMPLTLLLRSKLQELEPAGRHCLFIRAFDQLKQVVTPEV